MLLGLGTRTCLRPGAPHTHTWVAYTQAGVTRAVPRTDKTEEKAAMPRAGEWAAQNKLREARGRDSTQEKYGNCDNFSSALSIPHNQCLLT